jgi:uncharacterized phiE125 gp8 family phage protein
MRVRKITDAAVEPVTLAEDKAQLRVDFADDDARITGYITAARQEAEDICQRTLITTTWESVFDGFPEDGGPLRLLMARIIAASSLTYIDTAGVLQTLNPADYQVDVDSEPGYVAPGYDKAWPATRAVLNAVRVRYTAGYGAAAATVPAPIKQWLLLRITQHYNGCAGDQQAEMAQHPLLDVYRIRVF